LVRISHETPALPSEIFRRFPQSRGRFLDSISIRPLPSTSFTVHYSSGTKGNVSEEEPAAFIIGIGDLEDGGGRLLGNDKYIRDCVSTHHKRQ
jgi:hypothetical protein